MTQVPPPHVDGKKATYHHTSDGLGGIFSGMSRAKERADWKLKHQAHQGAEMGITSFALLNPDGSTRADAPFLWQGREYKSDRRGHFKIAESSYFDEVVAEDVAFRKFIDSQMDLALVSDRVFESIYGSQGLSELRSGGGFFVKDSRGQPRGISNDLIAIDATPDTIKLYAVKSKELNQAYQKLFLYLANHQQVIWTKATPTPNAQAHAPPDSVP